jgi:hypothetical protein
MTIQVCFCASGSSGMTGFAVTIVVPGVVTAFVAFADMVGPLFRLEKMIPAITAETHRQRQATATTAQ